MLKEILTALNSMVTRKNTSSGKSIKTKFPRRFRKASTDAGPANMVPSGSSDASSTDTESTQLLDAAPSSPPPPYEHVLAESSLAQQEQGPSTEQCDRASGATSSSSEQQTTQPKEILIIHKSTKSLYRALAAQWGITCKMSDQCPCLDCQSHYFDCEYDRDNDNEKTDGGLGAGTPMFISGVMHGTACTIL